MAEFIRASELNSSHIGKLVRLTFDLSQAEDILQGVKHTGRMISEGGLCGEPKLTVGGIETTLRFATLGEVDCEPSHKVTVLDEVKA